MHLNVVFRRVLNLDHPKFQAKLDTGWDPWRQFGEWHNHVFILVNGEVVQKPCKYRTSMSKPVFNFLEREMDKLGFTIWEDWQTLCFPPCSPSYCEDGCKQPFADYVMFQSETSREEDIESGMSEDEADEATQEYFDELFEKWVPEFLANYNTPDKLVHICVTYF